MSEMLEDKTDQIKRYIELRELDRAKSTLKDLYHQREADLFYYSCSGVIALMENDIEGAIGVLVEGTKVFSKALDLWYNLAYAYEAKSEWQLAKRAYETCLHCGCTFQETKEFLRKNKELNDIIRTTQNGADFKEREQDGSVEIIHSEIFTPYTEGDLLAETRMNVFAAFCYESDPLVTIYVVGYNKLELHTKRCIEYLLKYTEGIDYELILVDNGSSDGTLDYFKNVPFANKKIIRVTKNVGALYGPSLAIKQARGRYIVGVSNDIYVTENWLVNLLRCMFSSPEIGMAVPSTDNVSNLQDAGITFDTFEEMQEKAAEYNQSNPRKWHERLRIIPPMYIFNRTCMDVIGVTDYGFFHDFSDDDIAFRVRQAGYKVILCKDTFVCHAGKVEWKDKTEYDYSLDRGRKDFLKKYRGIDAWDDVNNYEIIMLNMIEAVADREYSVLGIDVRCGTPILEAKNKLIEMGAKQVRLEAFTQAPKYWSYLNSLTDASPGCDRIEHLAEHLQGRRYDFILIGEHVNSYGSLYNFFKDIKNALKENGTVLFKVNNYKDVYGYLGFFSASKKVQSYDLPVIEMLSLKKMLTDMGYRVDELIAMANPETVGREAEIGALVANFKVDNATSNRMVEQLMTDHYVIKMTLAGTEKAGE